MVDNLKKNFYVISVITNPERFKTRTRLFKEYMERMKKYEVNLVVVEGAFGERDFEVTDPSNPLHIQIRTPSEIWLKENLINIAINRLPDNWKYIAWIDGDIDFVRPDWVSETIHELQHHPIVQLFEDAIDTGPNFEVLKVYKSFAYCYKKNLPKKQTDASKQKELEAIKDNNVSYVDYNNYSNGYYWHPGFAWAATRDAINTIGGLFEIGILGAGDHHMACALIGDAKNSIPLGIHGNYKKYIFAWEKRALRLHKNIGYVKGTIYHFWHGKKSNRKYKERWQILIDNNYDPSNDIHKDWKGVLTLYPGHEKLRDQIREYFQIRNEDSIDND